MSILVQLRPLVDTPKYTVYLMENDSYNAKELSENSHFLHSVKNILKITKKSHSITKIPLQFFMEPSVPTKKSLVPM